MSGRLLRAVALAIFAGLAGPAVADLSFTTVYRDHLVEGTTPQAVWQYMNQHPIMDPDDGPGLANITHAHTLTFNTTTVGGVCRVSDLAFKWNFVVTLPKAVDYVKMSAATAGMWREFRAKAAWHEAHRRSIFLDCGQRFVRAAEAMTGPAGCAVLGSQVRAYVDRQYAACMRTQRAFGQADSQLVARLRLIRTARGER